MPLNPSIPMSGQGLQMPNFLGMYNTALDMQAKRYDRKLRTREEKFRESYGQKLGMGMEPEQAAMELQGEFPNLSQNQIANTRKMKQNQQEAQRKQQEAQRQRSQNMVNVLGPLAKGWNKMDEEDKIFKTPETISQLKQFGVVLSPDMTTADLDRTINMAGQQFSAQNLMAGTQEPASVREHKYWLGLPSDDARENYLNVKRASKMKLWTDEDGVDWWVDEYQNKTKVGKSHKAALDKAENKRKDSRLSLDWGKYSLDKADMDYKKELDNRKLTQQQAQQEYSMGSTADSLGILRSSASEIMESPALKKITGWRGVIWDRPGGEAADLRAMLTTLESQIAFTVLQNMRMASKTGGALGQVSERELELLKNNLAALRTSQSKEAFIRNLDKVVQFTERSTARMQKAYEKGWSGTVKQPSSRSEAIKTKPTLEDF